MGCICIDCCLKYQTNDLDLYKLKVTLEPKLLMFMMEIL